MKTFTILIHHFVAAITDFSPFPFFFLSLFPATPQFHSLIIAIIFFIRYGMRVYMSHCLCERNECEIQHMKTVRMMNSGYGRNSTIISAAIGQFERYGASDVLFFPHRHFCTPCLYRSSAQHCHHNCHFQIITKSFVKRSLSMRIWHWNRIQIRGIRRICKRSASEVKYQMEMKCIPLVREAQEKQTEQVKKDEKKKTQTKTQERKKNHYHYYYNYNWIFVWFVAWCTPLHQTANLPGSKNQHDTKMTLHA